MAAFVQLAIVGRGSNTYVYVMAIFKMCENIEQFICIKFYFKIGKKTQRKRINYCSKHTVKMQWVVHKLLSGSVPRLRDQRWGASSEAKQRSRYWRFFYFEGIVHHEYSPDGQTINKEFYVEFLRRLLESVRRKRPQNGGVATGSCTTTMRPHTHFTSCAAVFGQTRHRSVAAAAILTRPRTA